MTADAVPTRLRELSEAVLAATSVEEVVDAFLAAARALLGVDQIHLIELSQDATVGHGRAVAYEAGGLREDAYVMVLDERPSGTTAVVQTGEPVIVDEAHGSAMLRPDYVERFGVRTAAFVPVAWAGEVRWVAALIRTRPHPFAPADVELSRVMANLTAAGLALLERDASAGSRQDQDAALARAAAALNASLDLDTVLRTLTREADLALGGDMAGVYLGDGRRGGRATAGHNTPPEWDGYVMKPGEGVGGQVLKTGRSVISNAYQQEVRVPTNPGLRDLQTAVAVPMTWDGLLKGALSIGFASMRRITREDLRTLEAFADLAAVACRNAEAFSSAARVDALTGVLEHGAVQVALAEALAAGPTACLVVSLDTFGAINARDGHQRGDDVLRRTADALRHAAGDGTAVGRFGGDEFVVVAPADRADDLAARLRATGQETTLSIGLAVGRDDEDAAALLDRALAAARRAGGDAVVTDD